MLKQQDMSSKWILCKNFSLLQLYYPLIYLRSIISGTALTSKRKCPWGEMPIPPLLKQKRVQDPKPIRTIFIDITTVNDRETYRLLEIHFKDDLFDQVEVLSACEYHKEIESWKEKYVNMTYF